MERLIVQGEDLDLYPDSRLSMNFRINTISDISSRNSTYSNTVSIPRTPKNQRIFEYAGIIGSNGRAPYKKTRCTYQIGVITIIENGYLYLTTTTPEEYKVVLFDGIIDIQENLGEKTLKDLDLTAYDHSLTRATYEASFPNTSGYVYGVADYGVSIDKDITIEHQGPSMFAHTIWDQIFIDAGLTYTGDFFTNNTDFYEYVVTPSAGFVSENATEVQYIGEEGSQEQYVANDYGGYVPVQVEQPLDPILSNTDSRIQVNQAGEMYINYNGILSFKVLGGGTATKYNQGYQMVRVNGVQKFFFELDIDEGGAVSGFKTYQIGVSVGDTVSFYAEWYPQQIDSNLYSLWIDNSVSVEVSQVIEGFDIVIKDTLPEAKQVDFLKDMMQRYGLIMRKSQLSDTYEFIEIEKLLSDGSNVVDFTSKVVKFNNETYVSGYAQHNKAAYLYPSDSTSTPQDGEILIVNEVAPISKTIFKSIFEMPLTTYSAHGEVIYKIPIWEDKITNVDTKESKPKLMKINRVTKTVPTRYFTPNSTTDISAAFPFLVLTNVNYGYFLTTYYPRFKELLQDYKEIEVELNLNPVDIHNLDFFKLVYLKQTGRYYYLDSIKTGSKTTAKLIEIPNPNN